MGRPPVQARKEIDGLLERGLYLCDIAPTILAPEKLPEHEYFQREILHTPQAVVLEAGLASLELPADHRLLGDWVGCFLKE